VVALSPLSENWDTLAARPEGDASTLSLDPLWKPYCYDPSLDGDPLRYQEAYGAFAAWMAAESEAEWLILGQRLNRYEENCGRSAYDALVGFTAEAHDRVSVLEGAPRTIVSVDVEDLYGFPAKAGRCEQLTPADCLGERGELLEGLRADHLGLESYPAWALAEGQDWDAGWLTRVADLRPDLPPVISGTGFPSRDLFSKQGSCVPLLESSEQAQLLWLDRVLATASALSMELVVWTWLTEPVEGGAIAGCSCSEPPALCAHLSALGPAADPFRIRMNSGLWGVDGSPRQGSSIWTQMVLP
ncbi:MAG: hypothetical protein VX938_01710, partial [Myxococcota bacterium]|nr:hypothetical protein [Myxococcota bacterium]